MVTTPFQDRFSFEIDPFRKHCLVEGLDEIALTLTHNRQIEAYEARQRAEQAWVARGTGLAA